MRSCSCCRAVAIDGGRVMFGGCDLAAAATEMRKVRGAGIAMIYQ
jgi:ABC-type microcin C transport system duplicated ATPase subunit YejF